MKGDEDLRGRSVPFFTLPVAYFAHIIDFRSYVNATMSLYVQHRVFSSLANAADGDALYSWK